MTDPVISALVRKLRTQALPDPQDDREVLHAPLLRQAADEIERLYGLLAQCDAKPVAWEVIHFQDGNKKPNVSFHANYERAAYSFRRYGTPGVGINAGSLKALIYRPSLNAEVPCG